uniref:F-box domain-containing protein n=1 Tax=Setaria italica TaxID=4555 RepID=A0A0Q3VVC3_SETIT
MLVVTEDKWSQLPPELVHLICYKFPDTGNFICFRAVCTSWKHRGPRLQDRQHIQFYRHSSGKMYYVRVGGRSSWFLGNGAFQGHVIAIVDLVKTMLYNPLTSKAQAIRPAPYQPWLDGVFQVLGDGDAGSMVVNTCTITRHFAYYRPGVHAGWNIFDERKDIRHNTYNGGRFFDNMVDGNTLVIDATTRDVMTIVLAPSRDKFSTTLGDYLVASHRKILRALQYPLDGSQATG